MTDPGGCEQHRPAADAVRDAAPPRRDHELHGREHPKQEPDDYPLPPSDISDRGTSPRTAASRQHDAEPEQVDEHDHEDDEHRRLIRFRWE